MGTSSLQDLSMVKMQVCYCYKPDGVTFLDVIRDAPLLAGVQDGTNSSPSPLQIVLPRLFDQYDASGFSGSRKTIAQGNVLQFWMYGPGLPSTGLLRYQGFIDTINPQIGSGGSGAQETVTISLMPYGVTLGDHGITGAQEFGVPFKTSTYVDPVQMAYWFFTNNDPNTGNTYMHPLTWDPSNPSSSGVQTQYTFSAMTLADCMSKIMLMLPANWFYRVNPDKSFTLRQSSVNATHTFVIGQHCTAPTYQTDWTNLKNSIYFKGNYPTGWGPESLRVTKTDTGSNTIWGNFAKNHAGTYSVTYDPSFTVFTTLLVDAGPGTNVVWTPQSMTNIYAGMHLLVNDSGIFGDSSDPDGDNDPGEVLGISSVTNSTFTASSVYLHDHTNPVMLSPGQVSINTTSNTTVAPGSGSIVVADLTLIVPGITVYLSGGINSSPVSSFVQGSDVSTFGERLLMASDQRIVDQTAVDVLAQGLLDMNDVAQITAVIRLPDYRGDPYPTLGYDIENVKVGETCQVQDLSTPPMYLLRALPLPNGESWGTQVYTDPTAGQVLIIASWNYNTDYIDVSLSSFQPSISRSVLEIQQQLDDFTIF